MLNFNHYTIVIARHAVLWQSISRHCEERQRRSNLAFYTMGLLRFARNDTTATSVFTRHAVPRQSISRHCEELISMAISPCVIVRSKATKQSPLPYYGIASLRSQWHYGYIRLCEER